MLVYMNEEALEMTWRTGYTHGNVQRVVTMSYDCDSDALLVQVQQHNVACHTRGLARTPTPLWSARRGETAAAVMPG